MMDEMKVYFGLSTTKNNTMVVDSIRFEEGEYSVDEVVAKLPDILHLIVGAMNHRVELYCTAGRPYESVTLDVLARKHTNLIDELRQALSHLTSCYQSHFVSLNQVPPPLDKVKYTQGG
jgi:hypothetical protein